ncbi:MAG: tripartite tricarboxylate transporter substrate binding protein [Deltaproteobacteria bacterium]|nr:tripartite tricarboxylate transporter substrate binding protein [Deltaproteobacteria bacterium]MBW1994129.1 tripartite tricarboxylate transporter substrate binding protein [Deltaproteobacteria bacterium]
MKAQKYFLVLLSIFISLFLIVGAVSTASAKYPRKPIMWLVPWGPENESVTMGRIISEEMAKILGQKITVNAMPGGSGAKALKHVLSKRADGYLLIDAWVAPLIFVVLNRPDIGYTHKDFEPIGHISFMPFTLVVRKDSPWKTLEEFVKYARANPGLKYNATGAVSVPHAVMATFLKKAGIKARGVPYPGLAGGIKDLLGGSLEFSIGNFWVKKVYGEQTRTLCVFLDERHPWEPDIPTAKELGYDPGFGDAGMGWDSLAVKKGTPKDIVEKLQAAFKQAVTSKKVIEKCKKLNFWLVYKNPQETFKLWEQSRIHLKAGVEALKEEAAQFK